MKTIKRNLLLSTLAVLFMAVGAGRALAYDHDDSGWFDAHHQHHPYDHHDGHRGYWDHDQTGARIFISI
jgi:hypothetical protein